MRKPSGLADGDVIILTWQRMHPALATWDSSYYNSVMCGLVVTRWPQPPSGQSASGLDWGSTCMWVLHAGHEGLSGTAR